MQTEFKKEWTESDFKLIQNAIQKAFCGYPISTHHHPKGIVCLNFDALDNQLGFAYTSSSLYAGYWICNDDLKYMGQTITCFALDLENNIFSVLWDKDEKETILPIGDINHLNTSVLACKVVENVVYLPAKDGYNMTNYKEVRQAFLNAGAEYKNNSFIFPSPPQPYIDRITQGEKVNIKKEFQFFGTPAPIAAYLVELANINDPNLLVLEPSAGRGAIVNALLAKEPELCVHGYELMEMNRDILAGIKDFILMGNDFLNRDEISHGTHTTTNKKDLRYNRIVANPPFSKNQDIAHIYEMYECLAEGGRIVSIASKHWQTATNKKETEFKNWLESVGADIEEIPAGSFSESGTNVATCIIIINK